MNIHEHLHKFVEVLIVFYLPVHLSIIVVNNGVKNYASLIQTISIAFLCSGSRNWATQHINKLYVHTIWNCIEIYQHCRNQGRRQGRAPPSPDRNSFIFMQYSANKNRLAHPLSELAPPPRGKSWIRHWSGLSHVWQVEAS